MIQTVNVFLNHFDNKLFVGKLALKNRKIYFEYDESFIKKDIEISPYILPLKKELQVCNDNIFDGLFGVFADSLPDGWGKLLLDRHLMSKGINFHDITPLDRLCYVGKFGIGALGYEPIYEEIETKNQEIILDDLANSSINILNGSSYELLDTLLAIGGSSAGARPKIMAQINEQNNIIHGSQKLIEGFEHYIIKFPNSNDGLNIGKIEYIYSLMAKKANIEIPETKLLKGKKNSYFAIKRFDRIKDNRLHIHSVAGLTHSDFRVPSLDYDDLLTLCLHLTKDINEVKKLFRLAIFNLFTHNRDDHAKNFSFMLDEKNSWKLTPAYDLTFSYGVGTEHSTTYLNEGKNPNINHLEKLALKHGIKEYKQIIDEVKSAILEFPNLAKDMELPKNESSNLNKIFGELIGKR
ncbi:type II toxin-antitoxin system HipA family toxin [Aliarcobacter butzleri]|uniref:type II toxin-antitoxin system HipA family toxin n=1 Tax=Aliarcobacter butzleri TaxID=28197 RepID=UPI0021B3FC6D|nr:type II toxin-antitoxin system HipA family toxin [Aliarcobacter butzleri]MCT7617718.1 type II toxin-antitoxin system HipA family toxin [Aliarcobacter butzleri]